MQLFQTMCSLQVMVWSGVLLLPMGTNPPPWAAPLTIDMVVCVWVPPFQQWWPDGSWRWLVIGSTASLAVHLLVLGSWLVPSSTTLFSSSSPTVLH